MSSPADQLPQDPADPVFDRAQRRLARLSRVAELALELAEATQARAMAALAATPEPDAQVCDTQGREAAHYIHAFDRAARAVRLCSMLEARFEADLTGRAEATAEAARAEARALRDAEQARRYAERTPREVRREDLQAFVGQAIDARLADDGERTLHLRYAALAEKLEREWDDARHLDRPIGVVLKDLCTELGLDPDWTEFETEDFAIAEALAKTPGSPFAGRPLPWDEPEPEPEPEVDHATTIRQAMERAVRREAKSDDPADLARVAAEHARIWARASPSAQGP